jgi:hypothetical protein
MAQEPTKAGWGLQTSDFKLQTSEFRVQESESVYIMEEEVCIRVINCTLLPVKLSLIVVLNKHVICLTIPFCTCELQVINILCKVVNKTRIYINEDGCLFNIQHLVR